MTGEGCAAAIAMLGVINEILQLFYLTVYVRPMLMHTCLLSHTYGHYGAIQGAFKSSVLRL